MQTVNHRVNILFFIKLAPERFCHMRFKAGIDTGFFTFNRACSRYVPRLSLAHRHMKTAFRIFTVRLTLHH